MKILSIDTSSAVCSVAIVDVNTSTNEFSIIAFKNNNNELTHSQKLMPMISEIFNETNLSLDNIDLLACCIGPGSFTGIRIGLSSVKAFCDVKNIPIVGVTSLESLACNTSNTNSFIIPIIDAKNDNIYTAVFYCDENKNFQIKLEDFSDNIYEALNKFHSLTFSKNAKLYFVGNGSVKFKSLITETFSDYSVIFSEYNDQSAISLAKCAYNKYINGLYGNSSSVSPSYLKKSQAERIVAGESH